METLVKPQHGDFVIRFLDALTMALAVGESLEIIPRFVNGRLELALTEPWRILRDPDAPPRDPQGGLFWIHQEWMDYHLLLSGEEAGRYQDVRRVKDQGGGSGEDPFMTPEEIARRKDMIWQRSRFRTSVLVSEFWGEVIAPSGEMLLSRATFTGAAGRIIQKPLASPYRTLRWPGISFSPLPSILAHGGRGLLHGVRSLWEAMCQLMCLHEDALKWIVNPPMEINVDALDDPRDVATWPGKNYLVRDTLNGQQAVRVVLRRDNTNSILANLQYHDQIFQHGTFVSDAVQGLPGYRQEMTWRESQQNLYQAMGVFALMGANVESAAMQILAAIQEVVATHAGVADFERLLGKETVAQFGLSPAPGVDGSRQVANLPEMSDRWHVSGMSALMKDAETLRHLVEVWLPLAQNGRFAKYMRPYRALRALETRTSLADEQLLLDETTSGQIEQMDIQLYTTQERIALAREVMGLMGGAALGEGGIGMGKPTASPGRE